MQSAGHPGSDKNTIKDSTWAVAYGLCMLGLSKEEKVNLGVKTTVKNGWTRFLNWLKRFLP
jgi:hypothetical protein